MKKEGRFFKSSFFFFCFFQNKIVSLQMKKEKSYDN